MDSFLVIDFEEHKINLKTIENNNDDSLFCVDTPKSSKTARKIAGSYSIVGG